MEEDYQRSGRGGAGNFYSAEERAAIQRRAAEDLEAQKATIPGTSDPTFTMRQSVGPDYARSAGRGGAGNWYVSDDAPSTAEQDDSGTPSATSTADATASSLSSKDAKESSSAVQEALAKRQRLRAAIKYRIARSNDSEGLGGGAGGRSGWGNIYERKLEEERKRKAEEEKKEKMRGEVAVRVKEEVVGELKVPGRAFLGGRTGI